MRKKRRLAAIPDRDEAALVPIDRGALVQIGLGATYLVVGAAAVEIIDAMLGQTPLASALLGAIAVDMIGMRAGIEWGDRGEATSALVRKGGVGAAIGAAAGAIVIVAGALLRFAHVSFGAPQAALLFAVVRAIASAARDETLFRGITLNAGSRARVSDAYVLTFAALAGAAPLLFVREIEPSAVALALATGFAFALVWRRFGKVAAIGAHAAWSIVLDAFARGALLDVDWGKDSLALGAHASGRPAWLATGIVLAAIGAYVVRQRVRSRT